VQTTWLRLVENLDRIKDPERLGAWLATTVRHECLRQIRLRGRELPTEEDSVFDAPREEPVEAGLLTRERDEALRRALTTIGERCQALLRLLSAIDPPSYEEIGAALEMPVGAIGPTRARCLEKLRRSPELAGFQLT
jgi:RNA polymerase sigma factor (sigma-70 family)